MRAWDIYTADIHGEHPVVVISNQARVSSAKPEVVVLLCSTLRPGTVREVLGHEVILDEADGLELKTVCRCDLLYTVKKETLGRKRGEVSMARRRAIAQAVMSGLAFAGM